MRRLAVSLLTLALAAPAHAAGPSRGEAPVATDTGDGEDAGRVLEEARDAWSDGDWATVRALLEPMALEGQIEDAAVAEKALPLLADATLQDTALDSGTRRRLAGNHLDRLLDLDPDWRLPEGIYSLVLGEVFRERLDARQRARAAQCTAERNACRADLAQVEARHETLEADHEKLQKDYADQDVEVREQVKRSRAWALIPFGVGHFYNGNLVKGTTNRKERRNVTLGATFLIAEAAFGATGLGLLIWRNTVAGCRRESFATGGLNCTYDDGQAVADRRVAEEVMGWFFIGTMVVDVVLAQILFEPVSTTSVQRIKRSELEGPNEGQDKKPAPTRPKRPRAKVRPSTAVVPGGAGLGLRVRF